MSVITAWEHKPEEEQDSSPSVGKDQRQKEIVIVVTEVPRRQKEFCSVRNDLRDSV